MKRHDALIPLSRDHHEGLLLATRLQQGRKALLRLWSHDPIWQAEYVVKFFEDELVLHFEAEEKILFPLALLYVRKTEGIVRQLLDEHAEMRAMVGFFRHPDQKNLECTLERFGKLLESHIRCEERKLFPMCEESMPANQLAQAQESIERYRHQGDKR